MPRVSAEYRAQRREQILTSSWDLFARNGFHATSMAEVIAASGLSAGAVYLYFASKEDLIRATAEKALGHAQAVTGELLAKTEAVPPGDAAVGLITRIHEVHDATGGRLFPVAIQAWAEAVRNPRIAETARSFFANLTGDLTQIVERWAAAGHPVSGRPEHLALTMAGILQGYVIQQASFSVSWDPEYVRSLGDRITAMVAAELSPHQA